MPPAPTLALMPLVSRLTLGGGDGRVDIAADESRDRVSRQQKERGSDQCVTLNMEIRIHCCWLSFSRCLCDVRADLRA